MKYQRGDIVITAAGYAVGVYVITNVDSSRPKNAYDGLNLVNKKVYRLSDQSLGQKVGTATQEFLDGGKTDGNPLGNPAASLNFNKGRARAEFESRYSPLDTRHKWQILADAKTGDKLTVRANGYGSEVVEFQYVLDKGEKYVFTAMRRGRIYRYPLTALLSAVQQGPANVQAISQALVSRPPTAIIKDIQGIDCQLSPENLTCDGELPAEQVKVRQTQLLARRAVLVKELGREPTQGELWPELAARSAR